MSVKYVLRAGEANDEIWMFDLFRRTMQHYIDEAWGWDELLQREGFLSSLPIRQFQLLESQEQLIGGFHVSEKLDHFLLDMILVEPDHQRQGWGAIMAGEIRRTAEKNQKPVRLSVLKTNPAVDFHYKLGFEEIEQDEHSIKMVWPV
jgi:N-acetylglutamate synthase-like GNAT family acetyltransferase